MENAELISGSINKRNMKIRDWKLLLLYTQHVTCASSEKSMFIIYVWIWPLSVEPSSFSSSFPSNMYPLDWGINMNENKCVCVSYTVAKAERSSGTNSTREKEKKTEISKENLCLIEIEQTWKMSTQNHTYIHIIQTTSKMISNKQTTTTSQENAF